MMRPPLATAITALLGAVVPVTLISPAYAGGSQAHFCAGNVVSVSDREVERRRENSQRGLAALEASDQAMKQKDYEKAFSQYQLACNEIPNSQNTARLYARALHSFCEAAVAFAGQRITEGRYPEAKSALNVVLDERYDPNCKRARQMLVDLETPGYYNPTITPGFISQVEQVKQMFVEAKDFYDTARYDLAYKRCDQILAIDHFNIAARKLQEEINRKRDDVAVEGYNETRSRLVYEVDSRWDQPLRRFNINRQSGPIEGMITVSRPEKIKQKLSEIQIPKLEFHEATIREAIEFLQRKSKELDSEHQGVNFVLKLEAGGGEAVSAAPAAAAAPVIPGIDSVAPAVAPTPPPAALSGGGAASTPITVSLNNIPLIEALKYVTTLAGLKYKIEDYAIAIVPQTVNVDTLITRDWKVSPSMFSTGPSASGSGLLDAPASSAGGGGGAADRTHGAASSLANRVDAKDFLTSQGVAFPPGSSATYLPQSSKLIVKNTQDAMELIDAIVKLGDVVPAQVEVETKFVEIQQNNNKELSFDWLLGQANLPGTKNSFFGGGTSGTATGVDPNNFSFPVGNGTTQTFPVTTALRSGSQAISQNAIDALLQGTSGQASAAPANLAIAGVFTDPTFQMVLRALDRKQGVDLLSAPRVTTKSGQRAVVEVIREFRYPTEFEPPQIPQTFGNTNGGNIVTAATGASQQSQGSFPVTPTTPTAFEVRNTGVTLEVEPVIGPDNLTIDLNLVPQVVEFEGFINYGSPIQTSSTNALGQSVTNIITPNVINQPIFSTRKVTTSVSVQDGMTVLLGGLMREDVQKVEDKIPGLGDIPLFGRLFRSNVEQHLKTNLVMFVTARLINPAGEAVHPDEQPEEIVQTLPSPDAPEPALPLMPK